MAVLKLQRPYPKQIEFFKATARYVAYGGARGGGKSWAARTKLVLLALNYAGIQILLLRRHLTELRENHVLPLKQLLGEIAVYKEQSKEFWFPNGSRIVMGYCAGESDVLQYQGQGYDVILMEEATQFSEFQFMTLTECNRSSGMCQVPFVPRMYFTCNPGGVGHGWVKRLFIDRKYQNSERAEDYVFIKSLVYDNAFLMQNSPDYVRTLENLPENRKRAMLYGDWDVYQGQYFGEFDRQVHTCAPFEVPTSWRRYVSLDYGLDMLAVLLAAVDERGRIYVIRELHESDVIISDACEKIKQLCAGENVSAFFAPRDLWNRQRESGKSTQEIFANHGVRLTQAKVERVSGWYDVKEWLKVKEDAMGGVGADLMIFRTCTNLIRCIPLLQHDEHNPNDVATQPHEITHITDALRYLLAGRPIPNRVAAATKRASFRALAPKARFDGGKIVVV